MGVIGFRVNRRLYEAYKRLSSEEKERIKHFVEALLELKIAGYKITLGEAETTVKPAATVTPKPTTSRASGNMIRRLYEEFKAKANITEKTVKCEEITLELARQGYSQYMLELFTQHNLILVDEDTCTIT